MQCDSHDPESRVLDPALMLCLVFALPAFSMWKSLRQPMTAATPRTTRYMRMMIRISVLLLILALDWYITRRPLAGLGLDVPVSPYGQIGLAIAAALLGAVVISSGFEARRLSGDKLAAFKRKLESNDLLPRTAAETIRFALLSVIVGVGWEVLYRGFLLWYLAPIIGTLAAIAVAAVAYGLAHGYKSRGQLAGSIASAFVFTIAYAVTHSLWWLMVVHTFIGLSGGLSSYRMFKPVPSGTESALASESADQVSASVAQPSRSP